ncbi:hypothetical protein AAE478_000996 [Parahypoxylon ruwenzoriense]
MTSPSSPEDRETAPLLGPKSSFPPRRRDDDGVEEVPDNNGVSDPVKWIAPTAPSRMTNTLLRIAVFGFFLGPLFPVGAVSFAALVGLTNVLLHDDVYGSRRVFQQIPNTPYHKASEFSPLINFKEKKPRG